MELVQESNSYRAIPEYRKKKEEKRQVEIEQLEDPMIDNLMKNEDTNIKLEQSRASVDRPSLDPYFPPRFVPEFYAFRPSIYLQGSLHNRVRRMIIICSLPSAEGYTMPPDSHHLAVTSNYPLR